MSYQRTDWVTGDTVTATKLNNIENGIYTNETNIESLQEDVETLQTDLDTVEEALSTKAEIDGYYTEMTVGDAEQLVSTVYVEDKTPYTFRTAGGSVDIGNRVYVDAVVGGTLVMNQIAPYIKQTTWSANRSTFEYTVDAEMKATVTHDSSTAQTYGIYTSNEIMQKGHVVLVSAKINPAQSNKYQIYANGSSDRVTKTLTENVWGKIQGIVRNENNDTYLCVYGVTATQDESYQVKEIMAIDLTLMLGTSVADYVYSLEQATEGAGVAWMKNFILKKDYYQYSGPRLESSKPSMHRMVGFNQWDEEWENGAYNNATGEKVNNGAIIRSKNYIRVFPNTQYNFCASTPLNIYFYDAEKNFISVLGYATPNVVRTTPLNCHYINISTPSAYGTTYKNDICINISWSGSRNGEYEPYEVHEYALDSDELRGIIVIENGKIRFDGDRHLPDGTKEIRYGIVDLGTLNWAMGTYFSSGGIENLVKRPATNSNVAKIVCSAYATSSRTAISDKRISVQSNGLIVVQDSAYSIAADFKVAMSGMYLVYELATPTTETASPYNAVQLVNDFGTEEWVDAAYEAGTRDVAIPTGSEVRYPQNLRDKLQHLPSLSTAGDGLYCIQQTDSDMTLVPLPADIAELPDAPSADGSYVLTCTIADGTATYAWEAQ